MSQQILASAWHAATELPPNDVQVLAELQPRRKKGKPVFAVVEYMRTRKGIHDAPPGWFEPLTESEVTVLRWKHIEIKDTAEPFGVYIEREDGTSEFLRDGKAFEHATDVGYKFWTLYHGPVTAAVPAGLQALTGNPIGWVDPWSLLNFQSGRSTHEWLWDKPDTGLMPVFAHPLPALNLKTNESAEDAWRTRAMRAENMLEASAESRAYFLESIGRDYEAKRLRAATAEAVAAALPVLGYHVNFKLLETAETLMQNQGISDVAQELNTLRTALQAQKAPTANFSQVPLHFKEGVENGGYYLATDVIRALTVAGISMVMPQ